MLVKTFGSAVYGVDALTITVEVTTGFGGGNADIKYFMVGLPDSAIRESWQRVEAALRHTGFQMPRQKIVVNLSPADIKKEGTSYDLSIAVGILAASNQIISDEIGKYLIMGELSLDGSILPIKGALPIAIQARKEKFKGFILPKQNAREAAIVNQIDVIGVETLAEVIQFLEGEKAITPTVVDTRTEFANNIENSEYDFSDVKVPLHTQ